MIRYNNNIELVDYKQIENSLLIKIASKFFEFPENFHDFKVHTTSIEDYISIEFYNYRKTHCSILYHFKTNEVRFKKGIGGLNINYLKLVNLLIENKIWEFSAK